jgi:hypothetical protein
VPLEVYRLNDLVVSSVEVMFTVINGLRWYSSGFEEIDFTLKLNVLLTELSTVIVVPEMLMPSVKTFPAESLIMLSVTAHYRLSVGCYKAIVASSWFWTKV